MSVTPLSTVSTPSHERESTERSSTLLNLPKDLFNSILSFIKFNDESNLMNTCQKIKNQYWDSLFIPQRKQLDLGVNIMRGIKEKIFSATTNITNNYPNNCAAPLAQLEEPDQE